MTCHEPRSSAALRLDAAAAGIITAGTGMPGVTKLAILPGRFTCDTKRLLELIMPNPLPTMAYSISLRAHDPGLRTGNVSSSR